MPRPVACPRINVGVGAAGQVAKPVAIDISMIPWIVPASIAVKSTVAGVPALKRLEDETKTGTQQLTLK